VMEGSEEDNQVSKMGGMSRLNIKAMDRGQIAEDYESFNSGRDACTPKNDLSVEVTDELDALDQDLHLSRK
jgi:hypothetical protein